MTPSDFLDLRGRFGLVAAQRGWDLNSLETRKRLDALFLGWRLEVALQHLEMTLRAASGQD